MSWTKRQFVVMAYEELGFASYTYDLPPEQLESGMRRLDAMMSTLNAKGVRVGYPLPVSPEDSDLDAETNVPDKCNEAIYTNLAIRLAPTIGKTVSAETKRAAKMGYNALLALSTKPEPMQLPSNMPTGAGNKRETSDIPFSNSPDDPVAAGDDAVFDFE